MQTREGHPNARALGMQQLAKPVRDTHSAAVSSDFDIVLMSPQLVIHALRRWLHRQLSLGVVWLNMS